MRVVIYRCDRRGCTKTDECPESEPHPLGWVSVSGPGTVSIPESWHFCSWECAYGVYSQGARNGWPLLLTPSQS